MILFTRILVLVAFLMSTVVAPVRAADRIGFIRDAEVENTIRALAAPIFRAGGISPDSIRIHLVKDPQLNAFVAGGMQMFMNTGLLIRSENAGQVIGVIAHETGHITGGHLARLDEALRGATAESIIAMVLGAAAAAASGRGDVGAGVLMGSQSIAERSLLAYTRTQEQAADQAAARLLDTAGMSGKGLVEFMDILADQELLVASRQDPYVRTHPLTRDRLSFLHHHLDTSPHSAAAMPPEFAELHRRMRAKLFAFLEPPARTFQRYRDDDASLESRYARAVAHYRKPDLDKALPLIDGLIAERPKDPYFRELKGQMLFENGRAREAMAPYREAVRLLPGSALLRVSLAQIEIELGEDGLLEDAQQHLETALREERDNRFAWRLLATARGRLGDETGASLAMGEGALLGGRAAEALHHAGRAERGLKRASPGWVQAQDIRSRAEAMQAERKAR